MESLHITLLTAYLMNSLCQLFFSLKTFCFFRSRETVHLKRLIVGKTNERRMHREDDGKMGGGEKYAKIKKAEVQHRGAKWGCNNEFWVS